MLEIEVGKFRNDKLTPLNPPQLGVVQGTAITSTTAATAQQVMILARNSRAIFVLSSCASPVIVTMGPTQATAVAAFQLEAGNAISLDGDAGGIRFVQGMFIGVYNAGATPASGTLRVTLI